MGKVTNFSGQPVYNQLLNLLDKQKICEISKKTLKSESYVKKLDGYTHLVIMLYGILKHFDSLRELEIGMQAEAHKLHHLGIDYMVRRVPLPKPTRDAPRSSLLTYIRICLANMDSFWRTADQRGRARMK